MDRFTSTQTVVQSVKPGPTTAPSYPFSSTCTSTAAWGGVTNDRATSVQQWGAGGGGGGVMTDQWQFYEIWDSFMRDISERSLSTAPSESNKLTRGCRLSRQRSLLQDRCGAANLKGPGVKTAKHNWQADASSSDRCLSHINKAQKRRELQLIFNNRTGNASDSYELQ